MPARLPHLVTISGQDGPGIAARVFAVLGAHGVDVSDVEQVRIHGRLLLCVEVLGATAASGEDLRELIADQFPSGNVDVTIAPLLEADDLSDHDRFLVTVLAPEIAASTLEGVCARIADCRGNIERIVRLAAYPVHSYELAVAGEISTCCDVLWPRKPCGPRSTSRSKSTDCTGGRNT